MNNYFFRSTACIKAGFANWVAIAVLFFMLAMTLISTSGAHAGRIGKQFWSPLPSFSGGVGLFLPVTPLSQDNLKYWVTPKIQQAKDSGLQFINLIVHWRDLEPRDNAFSFDLLGQYVQSIKSAGLQCVLRIYFNGGWHIQASPDWLFTEKNAAWCLEGEYLQPLPWDDVYIQEMQFFMETLSNWMMDVTRVTPDAIQLSAGGIYGEMAVVGFDWQTMFSGDYDQFYILLMNAEKIHVDIFAAFSQKLESVPLILMINHLYDNNPEVNDWLLDYAQQTYGLKWFQSNAWSGDLEEEWFGPLVVDMMKRHTSTSLFSLEDESGFYHESLAQRIGRMQEIRNKTGVHFRAVMLNIGDLTDSNQPDIDYLSYWTQS